MAWTIRNSRTGFSQARFSTKEEAEKAWREMRVDENGMVYPLDQDIIELWKAHGWEWLETTCPKNPDFEKTKTATWIIKAQAKNPTVIKKTSLDE